MHFFSLKEGRRSAGHIVPTENSKAFYVAGIIQELASIEKVQAGN